MRQLIPGSDELDILKSELSWEFLQLDAETIIRSQLPDNIYLPYEQLGQNKVNLSKINNNRFSDDLSPLLQKYFESANPQFEKEIVEKAYVSSDETTRYERLFENFLRDRIAPVGDRRAEVLEPQKYKEMKLSSRIQASRGDKDVPGYLQLIIGAVGAGKSMFLKRYVQYLMPDDLKKATAFVLLDFNLAPDESSEARSWVCEQFVSAIRENYKDKVNLEDTATLTGVFRLNIRDRKGVYELLKQSGDGAYERQLAYAHYRHISYRSDPCPRLWFHSRTYTSRKGRVYRVHCTGDPKFQCGHIETNGHAWHINHPHTDVLHSRKNQVATLFLTYLKAEAERHLPSAPEERALFVGTLSALQRAKEALGLQSPQDNDEDALIEPLIGTFDSLFLKI